MTLVVLLMCVLVLGMAAGAIFVRSLGSAVILLSAVSLFASLIFLVLAAPDVAITEAAIGSALTTVVYVLALVRTGSVPWNTRPRKISIAKAEGISAENDDGNAGGTNA
jgi:uncharacterized MnhB-related membrane protein